MCARSRVKGDDLAPLYSSSPPETDPEFGGKISWNFNKFLIGRDGRASSTGFGSRIKPEAPELIKAVEEALGGAAAGPPGT